MVRVSHRSAEKNTCRPRVARYGNVLDRLGETISNRREMARCDRALTHYVKRPDLCAHWGIGCGAHHFIAGTHRRRPELGLSLLLVARRGAHFACVNERGVSRGSNVVASMVAARHRGEPGNAGNNLPRAWGAPSR